MLSSTGGVSHGKWIRFP